MRVAPGRVYVRWQLSAMCSTNISPGVSCADNGTRPDLPQAPRETLARRSLLARPRARRAGGVGVVYSKPPTANGSSRPQQARRLPGHYAAALTSHAASRHARMCPTGQANTIPIRAYVMPTRTASRAHGCRRASSMCVALRIVRQSWRAHRDAPDDTNPVHAPVVVAHELD